MDIYTKYKAFSSHKTQETLNYQADYK